MLFKSVPECTVNVSTSKPKGTSFNTSNVQYSVNLTQLPKTPSTSILLIYARWQTNIQQYQIF